MFQLSTKIAVVVCIAVACCSSNAEAARRGRSRNNAAAQKAARDRAIKSAQAQYTAAENVLSAANANGNAAASRLQAVIAAMATASQDMREQTTQIRSLHKDLADTEEDILREQSAESPYVLLSEQISEVKREMAAIEKQLLNTSEFIAHKAQVQAADGPVAVAKLREETLDGDPKYPSLKIKLESLTGNLSKIRHALFEHDPEWKSIHEAVIEAQKEERKASAEVYAHAPDRADPLRDIKDAKQAVAAASNVMAQAARVLKGYGAPTKPTTSSKSKK